MHFAFGAPSTDCTEHGVAIIEAKVYDSENNYVDGGPWPCDVGEGSIAFVPAGSNRTVVILGKDLEGNLIYRGQQTGIDVIPDSKNDAGVIELTTFVTHLQVPANGSIVAAGEAVLQWEEVDGATGYRVVVSQNSDLSDPVVDEATTTASHALSWLSSGGTYYWMIVATDFCGNVGNMSQIWSFTLPESD